MFSKVSKLIVKRHSEFIKILFPLSMIYGFAYTMNNGTTPFEDCKKKFLGKLMC